MFTVHGLDHALQLITAQYATHGQGVAEAVLHALFEDSSYPKQDRKGKRKRVESDSNAGLARGKPKAKVDFGSTARQPPDDPNYADLALILLQTAHPLMPKAHVRKRLRQHNSLFAPTFLFLEQEVKQRPLPYTPKRTAFHPPGGSKGKSRELVCLPLEEEQQWIRLKSQEDRVKDDEAVATELNNTEYENNDAGIECGCCFDKMPFVRNLTSVGIRVADLD